MNYKMLLIILIMHTYVTASDYAGIYGGDVELRKLAVLGALRIQQEYTTETVEYLTNYLYSGDFLEEALGSPHGRVGKPSRPISWTDEPGTELPSNWNSFFTDAALDEIANHFYKRNLGEYQLRYADHMQYAIRLYYQSAEVRKRLDQDSDRYGAAGCWMERGKRISSALRSLGFEEKGVGKKQAVPDVAYYRSRIVAKEIALRKLPRNGIITDYEYYGHGHYEDGTRATKNTLESRQYYLMELLRLRNEKDLVGELEPLKLPSRRQ